MACGEDQSLCRKLVVTRRHSSLRLGPVISGVNLTINYIPIIHNCDVVWASSSLFLSRLIQVRECLRQMILPEANDCVFT